MYNTIFGQTAVAFSGTPPEPDLPPRQRGNAFAPSWIPHVVFSSTLDADLKCFRGMPLTLAKVVSRATLDDRGGY